VSDAVAELEALVERMRELGVTEYQGIKLGPLPAAREPAMTPEQRALVERTRREHAEERRRDVLFAASRIKPVIRNEEE
jgi:hypothetical protein